MPEDASKLMVETIDFYLEEAPKLLSRMATAINQGDLTQAVLLSLRTDQEMRLLGADHEHQQ